jgi:hypothetical protein
MQLEFKDGQEFLDQAIFYPALENVEGVLEDVAARRHIQNLCYMLPRSQQLFVFL